MRQVRVHAPENRKRLRGKCLSFVVMKELPMVNNCPDCMSPMEAASMGINPCRHCDVAVICRLSDCVAWQLFAEKTKDTAESPEKKQAG